MQISSILRATSLSRWLVLLGVAGLLSLLQPRIHAPSIDGLWIPASGLGLVMLAWFGPRVLPLLLVASGLAGLRLACARPDSFLLEWTMASGEGLLQWLLLLAAWVGYRRAGGAPTLTDPRSAILFLLVPGGILALGALARALLVGVLTEPTPALWPEVSGYWLAQVLGMLTLAPLLISVLVPPLLRARVLERRTWSGTHLQAIANEFHRSGGEWFEVVALSIGTSLLTLVLVVTETPRQPTGWQLWGAPLLLIVWAGMRQGLTGATLAAASAAALVLNVLPTLRPDISLPAMVQANLFVQGCTALLVAASSNWVRLNEARYRQVLRRIPVGLYSARLLDPKIGPGKRPQVEVLFVSPPCQALLGCPPEGLLGDYGRWLARVHPEDQELLLAALAQLRRQSEPVVSEYRLAPDPATAPGMPTTTRWLRDTLVPLLDAHGEVEGWEGLVENITEQRVLADDLRRTMSMFQALVTNMPAGVFFVAAPSGRPILVNQRARQLLGQREDPLGKLEQLSEIYRLFRANGSPYPSEDHPVWLALQSGNSTMRDDMVVHRLDGRKIPLICWAAPLALNPGGRIDAIVWVLEDLTALRQAETARRETEGRLQTVVELMAEGVLVQNRQGGVNQCNAAARQLLGLTNGRPPESDPLASDALVWLLEDGTALATDQHPSRKALQQNVEMRNQILGLLRIPDPAPDNSRRLTDSALGRLRWVLLNALPLVTAPGARPSGVVTTMADLTDVIRAQHQLQQSEQRYRDLIESLPVVMLQFDRQLRLTFLNPLACTVLGSSLEQLEGINGWQHVILGEDLPQLLAAFRSALAGKQAQTPCRLRRREGLTSSFQVIAQPRLTAPRAEEAASRPHPLNAEGLEIIGLTALLLETPATLPLAD